MLSLSPRYDLFRFAFPKDFLPKEIEEKYASILNKNAGVLVSPIEYLNESIQGVNFPGISDIVIQQPQHSTNEIKRSLGKINVKPKREAIYQSTANPLEKIEQSFKVTFRMNQGLYNYFMMYETIFHQVCKNLDGEHIPMLYIELLNGEGVKTSRIVFKDVLIDLLDKYNFSSKNICLELTERCKNIPTALLCEDLTFFREHGIRIAIDDYGIGSSSSSMLSPNDGAKALRMKYSRSRKFLPLE